MAAYQAVHHGPSLPSVWQRPNREAAKVPYPSAQMTGTRTTSTCTPGPCHSACPTGRPVQAKCRPPCLSTRGKRIAHPAQWLQPRHIPPLGPSKNPGLSEMKLRIPPNRPSGSGSPVQGQGHRHAQLQKPCKHFLVEVLQVSRSACLKST